MDEIRRRDREVLLRELFAFGPLALSVILSGLGLIGGFDLGTLVWLVLVWAMHAFLGYRRSIPKRFHQRKYLMLWNACKDRLKRFHVAIASSRKRKIAPLEELPRTVEETSLSIYQALRRADAVMAEVSDSEGWLLSQPPPPPKNISTDAQAQELYRVADKNIAEYRKHFDAVVAGVHRAEGQAAVFTTTLDTIRLKLLSYRLTNERATEESQEFLESITEAKMQLDSIDKALEELELTPFPQTVSLIPEEQAESDEVHEKA